MKRLTTLYHVAKNVLFGEFLIITVDKDNVKVRGSMPPRKVKTVVNAFNEQLNLLA